MTDYENPVASIDNNDTKEKSSFALEAFDYISIILFAICLVIIVFSFFARLCVVDGPSMENTLYHSEKLIVSNVAYTPKAGDIVVFHETGSYYNEPIVKRVIAVAGETVHIEYFQDGMTVTVTDVNGVSRVLDEPYAKIVDANLYYEPMTVEVEEGTVFVLGDNRNHSSDSRSDRIGLVDTRRIIGKVIFRISPISRMGAVK